MAKQRAKKSRVSSKKGGTRVKGICFVIMPFGGWLDDYYVKIYCPAIKEAGLEPHRADDLYRPSTITTDIWTYTQAAKVILADLSGKNPNVFYELGLAHALAKPAIMITQSIDDIPFDLRSLRIILYDKNEAYWGEKLKQNITNAIRETIASPVEAILPAFLTVKLAPKPAQVSEHEKTLLELKREIDLVRNEVSARSSGDLASDENVERVSQIRPNGGSAIQREIRRRNLSPAEAMEQIRYYLKIGMPREVIVHRLRDRGVPRFWVQRRIEEISSRKNNRSRRRRTRSGAAMRARSYKQ